ncbi:MAG: hypothetical protein Q9219_000965 [cf. Caloplaca sp. 3 TL-2023]
MSRSVTEIVKLPLPSGVDIDNASSPTAKVISDTLNTLVQQEGYQRAFKGLQVEDPSILHIYVDWDSLDAHQKFMGQSYYGPFVKHLLSAVDGKMVVFHAEFTPHPPTAAISSTSAPATEIVRHFFSADLSDSDKSTFEENVQKFEKIVEKAEGFKGFACGWIIEEQEHPKVEGKAKLWQTCIGWQSVEAHMAFRESKDFLDNVDLMRPEFGKSITMHHVKFQEREYCPPLDPTLFYAIILDYDISDLSSINAARNTLDILKANAANDEDNSFDPSGTSRPHDPDEASSQYESSERPQSWHGDSASESTDMTAISSGLDSLNIERQIKDGDIQAGGSATAFQDLESLDTDQKTAVLTEMFPTMKPFDVEYALKKVAFDFGKAVEELLSQAFLESDKAAGGEGISNRGIDGFLDLGPPRGRKPKGKRKRQTRRTSSTPALSDGASTQSVPTLSRWDRAKEDIEFLVQRINLPRSTISSAYHRSSASLPLTIAALCSSVTSDTIAHDPFTSAELIDAHTAELALDFPTMPSAVIMSLVQLTYPSRTSAYELARASLTRSASEDELLVPHYVPRSPSPPSDPQQTRPRTSVMPLDAATRQAYASATARSNAFTQANAAYRKSKSKPLMGGAASYYSAVGRDASASLRRYEAAAADARVTAQSKIGEVDLHGVTVKDAVRIAQDQTERWWEAEGREWARAGKVMGGKGLRIVTGAGRHSEGGRGKLGPAVGATLVKEGWKVEVEQGVINVTGRARR